MTRFRLVDVALAALSWAACRPQAPEGSSSGSGAKPGTELRITLEMAVSSRTSNAGDLVVAKLASNVTRGERVLVPAGAEVRGKVVRAVPSGRVRSKARRVGP